MKLYDVIRKEELNDPKWKKKAPKPPEHLRQDYKKPVPLRKKILIYGGALAFLVVLYVLGIKVVRAKVVVTERRIPVTLSNVEFELPHQTDASDERLSFQSMVVNTTITREVFGSGVAQSNVKATGAVIFFNEYSTGKQTIKKGTTLTATNGKKYVTLEAASVPGYTTKDKKKVPGTSAAIKIQAAQVGASYNTTGTSFTVGGWGKSMYARSSGEITGGESGTVHVLTENEKKEALVTLQAQLIERLKRETRAQIPTDLVTFADLQSPIVDLKSLSFHGSGIRIPAKLSGSMITYLIRRDLLEQAIAQKSVNNATYAKVTIPDLTGLTVELLSPAPTSPTALPSEITLRISGTATIIAKVPMEKLKESLVGTKRRSFEKVFAAFPEIETAKVHMYPFWSTLFPATERKIRIQTK